MQFLNQLVDCVGVVPIHRNVVFIRAADVGIVESEQRHRRVLAADFALQHIGNEHRVQRVAHNHGFAPSAAKMHQLEIQIFYREPLGSHQAERSEHHHGNAPHTKPRRARDLLHNHIYHYQNNQRYYAERERAKKVVERREANDVGIAFAEKAHQKKHAYHHAIVAQNVETRNSGYVKCIGS